jgi:hypothetical protein
MLKKLVILAIINNFDKKDLKLGFSAPELNSKGRSVKILGLEAFYILENTKGIHSTPNL